MAVEIHEHIPNAISRPVTIIKSDKFKSEFRVTPSVGGYVFYEISMDAGKLPAELSGKYTRMKHAVDAVVDYERRAKPSRAVEDAKVKERRNAAKVQRGNTEHIHQGTDNGEVGTNLPD